MEFDISTQELPPIYKRGEKDCYLDPIRKKLIYVTPEETVRQKVIAYLLNDLKVPQQMISVEEHLSHYGVSSKRRADIVIHGFSDDDVKVPVAIIECKAPGIILGDKAGEQVADYCDTLGCNYAMLVNDVQCFCYHYNAARNEYLQIEGLPSYRDMLEGKFDMFDPGEFPERTPFSDIPIVLEKYREDMIEIGLQTDKEIACAAFNLLEGLLDPRHRMPTGQYGMFTLIEDYGVRTMSYGNASGGIFDGLYRSFIIDYAGSTEFVSIGLSTYGSYAHPEQDKTALNVAIDNEKDSHHSLQLVLDDNVQITGNKVSFFHHGKIGISNKGSGKVDELRNLVQERKPQLVHGKKFFLGTVTNNREWNLDDSEVIELIENLISYALIRDEYRNQVKKR